MNPLCCLVKDVRVFLENYDHLWFEVLFNEWPFLSVASSATSKSLHNLSNDI